MRISTEPKFLKFIDVLSQNEFEVILGYLNSESILLSLANPSILTIGTFENKRCFDFKNYENMDEHPTIQGPKPRVFIPELLNWIKYPYILRLLEKMPEFRVKVGNNECSEIMFDHYYKEGPNKKEPYLHYLVEGSRQLREINNRDDKERYQYISNLIQTAIEGYSEIEKKGIVLEPGIDSHLRPWLTAANLFAEEKGWT
ncbi:hypothetical protein [Methanolacinia petrolearia]|uniref:hypothetical protein n=1 Tax=Methanolacinia petrolearia TaxID=54120 RepID=UPI003BAAB55D